MWTRQQFWHFLQSKLLILVSQLNTHHQVSWLLIDICHSAQCPDLEEFYPPPRSDIHTIGASNTICPIQGRFKRPITPTNLYLLTKRGLHIWGAHLISRLENFGTALIWLPLSSIYVINAIKNSWWWQNQMLPFGFILWIKTYKYNSTWCP